MSSSATTMTTTDAPSVIVTGFHRSGTSAAARLLAMAGVDMGVDLIGPMRSNPFGHFEDRRFVRLHDAWLAEAGATWMTPTVPARPPDAAARAVAAASLAARQEPWGFKDPRAAFFLEAWLPMDPLVVVMVRHPAAAIHSLREREARRLVADGVRGLDALWEPGRVERMWLATYEAILETETDRLLVVSYEALAAGFDLVGLVAERSGLRLSDVATFEAVHPRYGLEQRPVPDQCEPVYRRLATLEVS